MTPRREQCSAINCHAALCLCVAPHGCPVSGAAPPHHLQGPWDFWAACYALLCVRGCLRGGPARVCMILASVFPLLLFLCAVTRRVKMSSLENVKRFRAALDEGDCHKLEYATKAVESWECESSDGLCDEIEEVGSPPPTDSVLSALALLCEHPCERGASAGTPVGRCPVATGNHPGS